MSNTVSAKDNSTTIHIRVDRDVKDEVEELYKSMGMNISTAVNMLFRQSLAEQAFPFHPKPRKLPKPKKTFQERTSGFEDTYEFEECDTGADVGSEVINDIYS